MKWAVKEGDKVNPGDVICDIETDKASVGFEVQEEGYIAKLLVPAGTKDIKLGTVLAIQTPKKEFVASFANYTLEAGAAAA
jgi:pyruvate dehydrogenase E2 component (dihydrolipoamide acetyltransferase)